MSFLQVIDPGEERDAVFDCPGGPGVSSGTVAGNGRRKLGNQPGMIENLLLGCLKVPLRAAQPQQIAMKQDLAMPDATAVMFDESLQCQRIKAIDTDIDEGVPGLFGKKMESICIGIRKV